MIPNRKINATHPGSLGRSTLEKEKLPIFGMIQRGAEVIIKMLANVQQQTIKPIIQESVTSLRIGATIEN